MHLVKEDDLRQCSKKTTYDFEGNVVAVPRRVYGPGNSLHYPFGNYEKLASTRFIADLEWTLYAGVIAGFVNNYSKRNTRLMVSLSLVIMNGMAIEKIKGGIPIYSKR